MGLPHVQLYAFTFLLRGAFLRCLASCRHGDFLKCFLRVKKWTLGLFLISTFSILLSFLHSLYFWKQPSFQMRFFCMHGCIAVSLADLLKARKKVRRALRDVEYASLIYVNKMFCWHMHSLCFWWRKQRFVSHSPSKKCFSRSHRGPPFMSDISGNFTLEDALINSQTDKLISAISSVHVKNSKVRGTQPRYCTKCRTLL